MGERILRFWRRLGNAMRRADFDRELAQELEFHLAMKQGEHEQAGLDPKRAGEKARREMGNLLQAQENSRETWMFLWVETLMKNVRYAFRVLLKNPVFTTCAVLTLAFGIGANAALFTLVDALLLRGLPVPEPDRMVQLALKGETETTPFPYPLFIDVRERTHSFSGMFTWSATNLWSGWGVQARPVLAAAASGEAYPTLGLVPQMGRLFTPSDDVSGAPLVVVISDRFWEREFHRDPRVIGHTMLLNQQSFTVIGVTPPNFLGVLAGVSPDVTITIHAEAALHPQWHMLDSKNNWSLSILARLKPGVSDAQARAELAAISPAILRNHVFDESKREQFLRQKLDLIPSAAGGSWLAQRYRESLLLLMSISGVILLLACVNLASLSLSRVAPRQKELSVRLALGAGRGRLIWQLLTESMLVSIAGAAIGTVFAFWATRGLVAFLSTQTLPLVLNLNPDGRVLCFLGVLALSTGLLFGIAPAIQGTDLQPNDALKQTRIGFEKSRHWFPLGKALVAVQVALSVLLIAGAILFIETLRNLKWQNSGFDRNNVVFLELNADNTGLKDEHLPNAYNALLEGVRRNALVRSATLTNMVPVSGSYEWDELKPELWPRLSERERTLYIHRVAPDYFRTIGLRLLRGRDFKANDASSSEQLGILSASAARTYFPKQDPVGQLLHENEKTTYRIIGVADDATYANFREQSPRTIYLKMKAPAFCHLVVRGELNKSAVVKEVRGLLKQTGEEIRLGEAISFTEQIDQALVTERLLSLLASFFAALAAALVAIGLYGVVGYSAARRTSEIGVRLALGATRRSVLWLVMREAMLLALMGAVVGVPAAVLGGQFAESVLYGVKPGNPATLAITVLLALLVAALAAFIPAFRASRLDPMRALHYE